MVTAPAWACFPWWFSLRLVWSACSEFASVVRSAGRTSAWSPRPPGSACSSPAAPARSRWPSFCRPAPESAAASKGCSWRRSAAGPWWPPWCASTSARTALGRPENGASPGAPARHAGPDARCAAPWWLSHTRARPARSRTRWRWSPAARDAGPQSPPPSAAPFSG